MNNTTSRTASWVSPSSSCILIPSTKITTPNSYNKPVYYPSTSISSAVQYNPTPNITYSERVQVKRDTKTAKETWNYSKERYRQNNNNKDC